MATVKKGILTLARQRWKHLRKWKRVFWKAERKAQARDTAKQDAKYMLAYHRICQKHGIAPSSSELIEAMKENE